MRKPAMTMIAAAALGLTTLAPLTASAGPAAITPVASGSRVHTVQYWGSGPRSYDDGWGHRRQWREGRQERDEAQVAEAARREAWRIEQEREQRRAWRHAERERQYGYGPGYYHRDW